MVKTDRLYVASTNVIVCDLLSQLYHAPYKPDLIISQNISFCNDH